MSATEKDVKNKKINCISTVGACKKLEDTAVEYVYKCKTSPSQLQKTLKSLTKTKTMLDSVNTKLSSILNASTKAKRYKRQDSTSFILVVQSFITLFNPTTVNSLGTNSVFIKSATTIIETPTTTITLTSLQIIQIETFTVTIFGFIQIVVARITVINLLIIDITGDKLQII